MKFLYFRVRGGVGFEIEMEVSGSAPFCQGIGRSVAQLIRHLTTNQGITGSNPARDNKSFVNILFLFLL